MTKIADIVNEIDDVSTRFDSQVDKAQSRLLNEVLGLTKNLSTREGRIMPTVENLKAINAIRNKIGKIVASPGYMKSVRDLLKSFETVQKQQIDYFSTQFEGKTLTSKFDITRKMAIENTAQALTQSGINANVAEGLKSMLVRSVVSGGMYSDLVGQVREFLTDTDKSAGALSRYAKTYASTSLSQFAGETNKLLTDEYNPKWYRYVGSNKETTREWCEHMTEKEWTHISEFAEIISGKVDGKEVEIYDRTGLPKGMIDGTKPENLLVNRGGWGCQHQFYAVDERIVPDSAKEKLKSQKTNDIVVSEADAMKIISEAQAKGEDVFYRGDIRDKGLVFSDDMTDYVDRGKVKNQGGFNFFTNKKSYAEEYATRTMNEEIRAKPTNSNVTAVVIKKGAKILDFRKMSAQDVANFELDFDKMAGHLDDYQRGVMNDILNLSTKALIKKHKWISFDDKTVSGARILNNGQTYSDYGKGKVFSSYLKENGYDGYVFQDFAMGSEYGIVNKDVFKPIAKYFIK